VDLVSVSLLRLISGKRLEVPVREFARYFKRDYRRVIEIHLRDPEALAILGLNAREMREMPHWGLGVEVPQNSEHSLNSRVPRRPKSPPSDVGWVSFISAFAFGELPQSRVSWLAGQQNKLLYDELPDSLWQASCAICRNTPRLIATQWQQFHLQTSLSLRFVTLLNTMDLLQRLVGAIILVNLRAAQGLPESIVKDPKFLSRGSFGEWNKVIETALEAEHPFLAEWRAKLLIDRSDFPDLLNMLAPLWNLIGNRVAPTKLHTLSAWRVLGLLRNEFIGHGTMGTAMAIAPMQFISALHSYFLRTVAQIVKTDLSIALFSGESHAPQYDRGFTETALLNTDSLAAIRMPNGSFQPLAPYIIMDKDRMLILNRMLDEYADYVNFEARNSLEPSFIPLPMSSESIRSVPYDRRLPLAEIAHKGI
jgi:hypothetical protein